MPNKYLYAALSLMLAGAFFITLALVLPLGDYTSSALVISSMACIMTAIFTLAFSRGEPVDPWLVGILPAQGSLNIRCIIKQFGIEGNAFFLPNRVTGKSRVLQFNPTLTSNKKQGFARGSITGTGPHGLVSLPSCGLLVEDLKKRNALVIPQTDDGLSRLISETIEDVYKFAPSVSVHWEGSKVPVPYYHKVTVTFHHYPYIEGCKVIAQKSLNCCAISPCPVCSLCGVLIAEGKDMVVTLDWCATSYPSNDVTAVFSLIPLPDSNP
jgi:hypothetical protein